MHERLKSIFGDRFKENEPMSKHTNFRIGGPARYFVEVRSVDELQAILQLISDPSQTLPLVRGGMPHRRGERAWCVLGGGSNMLVSDKGFDGLMIKMAMRDIKVDKNRIQAEAGALMTMVSRKSADAGLTGMEWAITLPGTVGGAVRGNAGCFGGETRDHLVEVILLSNGQIVTRSNGELKFGYRESAIKHTDDIVLSATFQFVEGDREKIKQTMDANLQKRKSSQPLDAGSAGCMFKNYEIRDDVELVEIQSKIELPQQMIASRRLSAGWLIDQLDLKGKQIGGAKVSETHGNFLVNTGNATADEVVQLIAFIKTRVRNALGITLQEEVQYVGF